MFGFTPTRRKFLQLTGSATVALTALCHSGRLFAAPPAKVPGQGRRLDEEAAQARRLLQRASFGATPADIDYVKQVGIANYIQEQLDWTAVDDSAVEQFIQSSYPAVNMNACDLQSQSGYTIWWALAASRLIRATHSRRQLYERMAGFWLDHFNITYQGKEIGYRLALYERDVVRPHALGQFRDLLHATAASPAMLVYLDNWRSTNKGPNENYARELLELHTLGVDGGYAEQDVKEIARCFTGWGISWGEDGWPCAGGNGFYFRDSLHDSGSKTVLGHAISATGMDEARQVLDMLVDHPSTARHLARKLCRYFVGESASESLVSNTAAAFGQDGDIAAMLRTILESDELAQNTERLYRRPFEYAAASLRTTGIGMQDYGHDLMARMITLTGHQPYQWPDPDGYPVEQAFWVNTNGHLARWQFAYFLSLWQSPEGDTHGLSLAGDAESAEAIVDTLSQKILGQSLENSQRAALIDYVSFGQDPQAPLHDFFRKPAAVYAAALLLSSADYQLY